MKFHRRMVILQLSSLLDQKRTRTELCLIMRLVKWEDLLYIWANSKLINFENIRDIVIHKGIDSITTINKQTISRLSRKRKLYNRIEEKEYRMVYTKNTSSE
jgi:hypothetical protein